MKEHSRYGSSTLKQVYSTAAWTPGRPSSTAASASLGALAAGCLFPYLRKIGPAAVLALEQRVAAELKTTFTRHYAKEISLAEMLDLDMIARYSQRRTGEVPDQSGPGVEHRRLSTTPGAIASRASSPGKGTCASAAEVRPRATHPLARWSEQPCGSWVRCPSSPA